MNISNEQLRQLIDLFVQSKPLLAQAQEAIKNQDIGSLIRHAEYAQTPFPLSGLEMEVLSRAVSEAESLAKQARNVEIQARDAMYLQEIIKTIAQSSGPVLRSVIEDDFSESLIDRAIAEALVAEDELGMLQLGARAKEQLQQESTAYEEPEQLTMQQSSVPALFDPDKIHVATEEASVFDVLDQIKEGSIWLQPDFQRNFVWDEVRQSQLIESILLRIPLPAFYLDAERDDRLQVIDGLQRLTTLRRFCTDKTLRLRGLKYLTDLIGSGYDDLSPGMRTIILRRTRLNLYIIRSDTPKSVKYEIFSRVNRNGMALMRQEIRHALYQGPATDLLKSLANDELFLEVTQRSINPLRMDDRECILRFIAFSLFKYTSFRSSEPGAPQNLDELLNATMDELNRRTVFVHNQISDSFRNNLKKAYAIFGEQSFRRFELSNIDLVKLAEGKLEWNSFRRNPINKPLFETWMVSLEPYDIDTIVKYQTDIIKAFLRPLSDNDFINSITYGTGSQKAISYRFGTIERMLERVLK